VLLDISTFATALNCDQSAIVEKLDGKATASPFTYRTPASAVKIVGLIPNCITPVLRTKLDKNPIEPLLVDKLAACMYPVLILLAFSVFTFITLLLALLPLPSHLGTVI
jgi:hypothetical protein